MVGLISRVGNAVRHPGAALEWTRYRPTPSLWRRQAEQARALGLQSPLMILSFDCDTPDDIAAMARLHPRLQGLGITPVLAVPGDLLRAGAEVYRRLHEAGAEFLNHGGRQHTFFDESAGRWASCFFYDEIGPAMVRADLEQGHADVQEVLGSPPRGLRVPHFGTFNRREDLSYVHRIGRELGYAFSSSALPRWAYRGGPVLFDFGLAEVPVSGMASAPLNVLDSWSCFAAPDRHKTPADYVQEARATAANLATAGAGILNVYVDPVHVVDEPAFAEALLAWREVAEPTTFGELLERIR